MKFTLAAVLAALALTSTQDVNAISIGHHTKHHKFYKSGQAKRARARGDDEEPNQIKGYKSTRIDNGEDDDFDVLGYHGRA